MALDDFSASQFVLPASKVSVETGTTIFTKAFAPSFSD